MAIQWKKDLVQTLFQMLQEKAKKIVYRGNHDKLPYLTVEARPGCFRLTADGEGIEVDPLSEFPVVPCLVGFFVVSILGEDDAPLFQTEVYFNGNGDVSLKSHSAG